MEIGVGWLDVPFVLEGDFGEEIVGVCEALFEMLRHG